MQAILAAKEFKSGDPCAQQGNAGHNNAVRKAQRAMKYGVCAAYLYLYYSQADNVSRMLSYAKSRLATATKCMQCMVRCSTVRFARYCKHSNTLKSAGVAQMHHTQCTECKRNHAHDERDIPESMQEVWRSAHHSRQKVRAEFCAYVR